MGTTVAEIAKEHGGRFLLRRLYGAAFARHDEPPEWIEARELVKSGHARWISPTSNFAPGIELTGKPFA